MLPSGHPLDARDPQFKKNRVCSYSYEDYKYELVYYYVKCQDIYKVIL